MTTNAIDLDSIGERQRRTSSNTASGPYNNNGNNNNISNNITPLSYHTVGVAVPSSTSLQSSYFQNDVILHKQLLDKITRRLLPFIMVRLRHLPSPVTTRIAVSIKY
jgi:hypothetical protein